MLQCAMCGTLTGHKNGFVFKSEQLPHYLLMCFRTPFFCIIDGKKIVGKEGDCILHRPGDTVVHGPLTNDTQFINDWIYFFDDAGDIEKLDLCFNAIIPVGLPDAFLNEIDNITRETVYNDKFSDRIISEQIARMLVTMKRARQKLHYERDEIAEKFSNLRVHILSHYRERWTLERMASEISYSPSRFSAIYSEFFGISPINDLLEKRLEVAKKLLALRAFKIGDVADMCGFSSIHYFSNFFKKRMGVAPEEYS